MSLFNFGFQQAKLAIWFQPLVNRLPCTGITFVAPLIRRDIFSLRYYAQIRGEPHRDLIKICGSLWMLRDALMWKRGMGFYPSGARSSRRKSKGEDDPDTILQCAFSPQSQGGQGEVQSQLFPERTKLRIISSTKHHSSLPTTVRYGQHQFIIMMPRL